MIVKLYMTFRDMSHVGILTFSFDILENDLRHVLD